MKKKFTYDRFDERFTVPDHVLEKTIFSVLKKYLVPLMCLSLGYAIFYRFNLTKQEMIESPNRLQSFVIK